MDAYATYARFYDATQEVSRVAHYRRLLERHHPEARTLLELACGTATHLAALAERYTVEGLDLSRAMLTYARRKLPNVTFHHQDMSRFSIASRFDAIICPYDSINHLLRFSDWERTFRLAKRHLSPGGVFVFDVNTEYRLRELASSPPWIKRFGSNYLIMNVSLSKRGVSDWAIRIFERIDDRDYRLHCEVVKERSFDKQRVLAALRSHFRRVRTYDPVGWSRSKSSTRRLFYVCQ